MYLGQFDYTFLKDLILFSQYPTRKIYRTGWHFTGVQESDFKGSPNGELRTRSFQSVFRQKVLEKYCRRLQWILDCLLN